VVDICAEEPLLPLPKMELLPESFRYDDEEGPIELGTDDRPTGMGSTLSPMLTPAAMFWNVIFVESAATGAGRCTRLVVGAPLL
jgi:hypothetical protein